VFRGNNPAKVDDKGRLKIPSAFKAIIDASNVTQFYITSADGKSAEIWPLPEWEKKERKLAQHSTLNKAVQKYLSLTSYYGQQVEMDSQARVVLPQILRDNAKLDAEVVVFGKLVYLDVRNERDFKQQIPDLLMTDEDNAALAAITSEVSG
jgi:MraZ protein